jgi:DNA-binding PadR family transcriptional regulator
MRRNAKVTTLEHALLGLAAQQPRSGYDFKTLFESTALRQFSSSPGSIYPALKRLEGRGLLASRKEPGAGDRSRRIYEVTPKGKQALRSWLEHPATVGELRLDLRLPLLRFSLFGSINMPMDKAVSFLEGLIAAAKQFQVELNPSVSELARLQDPYPGLALDHGIRGLKELQEWSRSAIERLKGD